MLIGTWPPEDIKAHINFMHRFNKELKEAGELVGAEGLAGPEQARVVRARKGGGPEVTDGPFAEAKEFLAGYWIVAILGHLCTSRTYGWPRPGRRRRSPQPTPPSRALRVSSAPRPPGRGRSRRSAGTDGPPHRGPSVNFPS